MDTSDAENHSIYRSMGADTFETSMRMANGLLAALDGGPLILDPGAFPILVAELDQLALDHALEVSEHGHHETH